MRTERIKNAVHNSVEFRPEKKMFVAGKILREYSKDGVRMYAVEGSKNPFVADKYDSMFKTVKQAILPKNHKGKNPDGTHVK